MMKQRLISSVVLPSVAVVAIISGCESTYYKTMEQFGVHKRDILVDQVEDARDSQEEAKEQFQSALEKFSSVVGFEGGTLEEKYNQLKSELEQSEKKAKAVRGRIADVEDVAEDLFGEWEAELELYSSANLRRSSEKKLAQTRQSYQKLIRAMKRAEAKIDPVLIPLRDQVLYLKHNLNAQAIASLKGELVSVEADVESLIREMESAIAEANAFIGTLEEE